MIEIESHSKKTLILGEAWHIWPKRNDELRARSCWKVKVNNREPLQSTQILPHLRQQSPLAPWPLRSKKLSCGYNQSRSAIPWSPHCSYRKCPTNITQNYRRCILRSSAANQSRRGTLCQIEGMACSDRYPI